MARIKRSIAIKVSLIVIIMLLAVSVIIAGFSLYFYQQEQFAIYATLTKDIAVTAATNIDGDRYEELTALAEPDDYWDTLKASFDTTKTEADLMYLYALGTGTDGDIPYVVEGMKPADEPENIGGFGEVDDPGSFAEEAFETLRSGQPTTTGIYDSDGYGLTVSGFAPILNSNHEVVGVIGADISLDTVMNSILTFVLQIVVVMLVVTVISAFIVTRYMNRSVGQPLKALSAASRQIAVGDMEIGVKANTDDEIGELTTSFNDMADSTRHQIEVLSYIAEGDYTPKIEPRSEKDSLNKAIIHILKNNVDLISNMRQASQQVAAGAAQIADSSQALATGSTQQAATLDAFSATIDAILDKAQQNTELGAQAVEGVNEAGNLMDESMGQMKEMTSAMQTIEKSSQEIQNVIKVIDDIAFQTNILALNAAVEAARAGQHGKGFAVVADEVRNLAQKSAAAANETGELIESSVKSVTHGADVAVNTEQSLSQAGELVQANVGNIREMSESSTEQSMSIDEIKREMSEISAVVQTNSSTAEESAALAEEMSAQATLLENIVAQFRLPDSPTPPARAALPSADF